MSVEINFSSVLILTFSNWKQENNQASRHYALSFSAEKKVIVLQVDLDEENYFFEKTEHEHIEILHIYSKNRSVSQLKLLSKALIEKEVIVPLIWVDSYRFYALVRHIHSPFKVFHFDVNHEYQSYPIIDNKEIVEDMVKVVNLLTYENKETKGFLEQTSSINLSKTVYVNRKIKLKNILATYQASHTQTQKILKNNYSSNQLNILVLYRPEFVCVSAIQDHLKSFRYDKYANVFYCPSRNVSVPINFTLFDVIIVHFSLAISTKNTFEPEMVEQLRSYSSMKVLFSQDDYEQTNNIKYWIKTLGIQLVYTVVPEEEIEKVYPSSEFKEVTFKSILTGYVSDTLLKKPYIPHEKRKLYIAYRGREKPIWRGDLLQEKKNIGVKMKDICARKGLPVDISWTEEDRIYGEDWCDFLGSARATLGTESGSNIFDFDGSIRKEVTAYLKTNPNATYETIRSLFLAPHEGKVRMNQISPKLFESIALRTALILFEGDYSGILKPHKHYIPLKKDFSNVDGVLEKLNDIHYLKELTDRAYQDIVESGKYSYKQFATSFYEDIISRITIPLAYQLIHGPVAVLDTNQMDCYPEKKILNHLVNQQFLPVTTCLDIDIINNSFQINAVTNKKNLYPQYIRMETFNKEFNTIVEQKDWGKLTTFTEYHLSSDHFSVFIPLIDVNMSLNRFEQAEKMIQRGLELAPNEIHFILNNAKILFLKEQWADVIVFCQKSMNLVKDWRLLSYIARGYMKLKKYPESIDYFKQSLALNDKNARTWLSLGNALFANWKFKEAIAAYSKVKTFTKIVKKKNTLKN